MRRLCHERQPQAREFAIRQPACGHHPSGTVGRRSTVAALTDQFAPPHVSFGPRHQIGCVRRRAVAALTFPSLDETIRPRAARQPPDNHSVEPLKHQRFRVDDAAMRHFVLEHKRPGCAVVEILPKVTRTGLCVPVILSSLPARTSCGIRAALGESVMVSTPSGSPCPGFPAMTATMRSGAYSANLPTREPVPENPSRIRLADASSGCPERAANSVRAANSARPIPLEGSTFMSPPVSLPRSGMATSAPDRDARRTTECPGRRIPEHVAAAIEDHPDTPHRPRWVRKRQLIPARRCQVFACLWLHRRLKHNAWCSSSRFSSLQANHPLSDDQALTQRTERLRKMSAALPRVHAGKRSPSVESPNHVLSLPTRPPRKLNDTAGSLYPSPDVRGGGQVSDVWSARLLILPIGLRG